MMRANRFLFRSLQLAPFAAMLVALAGCPGPDPTNFSCNSSAECPSGYHCNLGTASSAGTFKCASGAPQQKTLAADGSKFLLARRPSADGSIRTTISAEVDAVSSSPDFIGVRIIAKQGTTELARSQVLDDGSVLQFQLPDPTAQVSLVVQDDSGHSIPVTDYMQEEELSFLGKDVPGSSNANVAYDATTQNDGVFPPDIWIATGPGPDGRVKEFTASDVVGTDGGVQSSASYASIGAADYATASTTSPPIPTFGSFAPPVPGSAIAWQPFSPLPTTDAPDGGPPPRAGAALAATSGGFFMFGGGNEAGTPADPAGTFYAFSSSTGWSLMPAPVGQLPSARAGAAAGRQASGGTCFANSFVAPCDFDDHRLVVAGGVGASGMTNEIQLFTNKRVFTSFSLPPTETNSWKLVGLLPFANAGMESAAGVIPFNAVVGGANTSVSYSGGMMIYGQAVNAANSATQGCVLFGAAPQSAPFGSAPPPIQPNTASCVGPAVAGPAAFDQAGAIGFRTGATLVADPGTTPTTFYLFGGRKTTGATTTALQNDIWKATITCTPPAVGAACATTTTWTQVSGGGVGASFPTPRSGAGGAIWSSGRLVIFGGADAGGTQTDLWEWDFTAAAWRQVVQDRTTGILSPPARSRFAMVGDLDSNRQKIYTFGGTLQGGAVTDQLWLTGRESAAKLLVKMPFSLPALDQAKNFKLTVDALGTQGEQAFVWDGTTWRYLGSSNFESVPHLLATTTVPVTALLQPDGNLYFLLMQTNRNQFTFTNFVFQGPVAMDRLKVTVQFQ